MESLAQLHIWWPGIDEKIELFVKTCTSCSQNTQDPIKVAFSKWPKIHYMESTTTKVTIKHLRQIFATHGLPRQIVSEDGPQFVTTVFQKFCES